MKITDAKIGDTIYFNSAWIGIAAGIITDIKVNSSTKQEYFELKMTNGPLGTRGCLPEEAYFTYEECANAKKEKQQQEVTAYKAQIMNMKQLIQFALDKDFSGENSDYAARIAYQERAQELLNSEFELER